MYAKKNSGMKVVATLLAIALLIGGVIGGTIAYLMDTTDPVTNTFTTSDVDITLTESENLDLQMVPGRDINKDPKVTVLAGSEECWLFVKIEETESSPNQITTGAADATTYITYTVADGWTPLEGNPGVYYRDHVATGTSDGTPISVLREDKVSVPNTVTKSMMETAQTAAPKLTFTAYAVQKENVDSAAAAWAVLNPTPNP